MIERLHINNDGLLCREIVIAKPMMDCWLSELVSDCDAAETKILTDILISAKNTLRKNRITE